MIIAGVSITHKTYVVYFYKFKSVLQAFNCYELAIV